MADGTAYGTDYHVPVLLEEVLEGLAVGSGGRFVDGTVGGAGHTTAILERSAPDGRVLGIDRDPEALQQARERLGAELADGRLVLVQGNYDDAAGILEEQGWEPADGFLVDAGVSSHQLDDPTRGFSFREAGPLDMRMGPDAPTLDAYLAGVDQEELARALRDYGEIRSARRIAAAILEAHGAGDLQTTADLAAVVERTIGGGAGSGRRTTINPATLVFQGLRIAVNDELASLERAVASIPEVVRPGGRAAFISFHSLEDRIVKRGLRHLAQDCVCPTGLPRCACEKRAQVEILTSRPITAGEEELSKNPRARSAKLRVARVL